MAKVFYTGAFRFPDGDAAAARVLGIGKALRDAGYEVEYAGWEEQERTQDRQADGKYIFEGFRYTSQADLRSRQLSPVKRLVRYLSAGKNTLSWFRSQDMANVDAIIAYHGSSLFLAKMAAFCHERGIKFIVDCTEWYDPRRLVGGRFGLVSLDNALRMRFMNTRIGSVIAISSYLERYYSKMGCRIINIPPLIDLEDEKWHVPQASKIDHSTLRLVYAGVPGKKDLLGNALRGLKELKRQGYPVEIHLVGPSRDAVSACLGKDISILDAINDSVVFHGRVPQGEVPRYLASADFSILIRPQERYAEAGFPTKLVESLAAGVPVIANLSSDIAKYVFHGHEGILLRDHSPTAFIEGVREAVSMSTVQRQEMRIKARNRAKSSFEYKVYTDNLRSFLENS